MDTPIKSVVWNVLTQAIQHDRSRPELISSVANTFNDVPIARSEYMHDKIARRTQRLDYSGVSIITNTFAYNVRSEVTGVNLNTVDYAYAYDNIGNHTTSTVDSVSTTYTANNLNQYSQVSVPSVPSVENLSYDQDGNMLTNGVFSYSWDAENRLVSAYSNSVCVVSNAYDYMNRRVLKVTPTSTHTFIYDGWNLVQETINDQQSTITNHFVWGKDLSGTIQGAGGVGGLLATCMDGDWYFPFYDANGNVIAYIDESGTVVAEYVYDAFGDTIAQSRSLAETFSYRFSTKYYDPETDLYYYGMRFYSPELHRWLNRDPIEENGGIGLYGFCENDGVNGVDPQGMASVKCVTWVSVEGFLDKIRHKGAVAKSIEVNSVNDIEIDFRPITGVWGYFSYPIDDIVVADGDCEISLNLSIVVRTGLQKSGTKGMKYSYSIHNNVGGSLGGGNSGVSGGTSIDPLLLEGEVIAHERGHAEAFLEYTKPCFEKAIKAKYPGALKAADTEEIRRIMRDCRRKTMDKNVELSNKRTLEWYRVNKYIEKSYYNGSYYVFEL